MKSVVAALALEWIAREFDPEIVVVWRHPLNLVPAWIDQGWLYADKQQATPAVRARFEHTSAWPPPSGPGPQAVAWAACVESVLLHETAAKHSDWIVISHENQCINPTTGFRALYDRLDLDWSDRVVRALTASNAPGTGFDTNRPASDEPKRWRSRLSPAEQHDIGEVLRVFEDVSPVSAELWRASPAVV